MGSILPHLNASRDTPRRKFGVWCLENIPVIGKWVCMALMTRAEKQEYDTSFKDVEKVMKVGEEFLTECLEKYPAIRPWFTDEKIALNSGGRLLASVALANFDSFFDINKFAPFFEKFITTDEAYRVMMTGLMLLNREMEASGFMDSDGNLNPKDIDAIEQMLYGGMAERLSKAMPDKWKYEALRVQISYYL